MCNKIIILFITSVIPIFCQEPFNVNCVDPPTIKVRNYDSQFGYSNKSNLQIDSTPTFFGNINSNFLFGEKNNNLLPSINISLITYRLIVYSKNDGNGEYRYYLPLILLTKISNYDSTNLNSIYDLSNFIGSPITFRLMPNFRFPIGEENYLNAGLILDGRYCLYKDSTSQNLKSTYDIYTALGIKYSGKGDVRDESGQKYEGVWSISIILFGFFSKDESIKNLFKENKSYNTGLEGLFKFNVLDTKIAKLNLNLSIQNFINNSPLNGNSYIIKFGIGN